MMNFGMFAWKKTLAVMLAGLMLVGSMVACTPSATPDDDTSAPEESQTRLEITETTGPESPKDPWETAVLFAGEGAETYTIVVPTYATAWETQAATELATF